MDINLTTLFDDFYHTRFFVLVCLSFFTLLFSLRLDQVLKCSYWIVFCPLWIWKLTALFGIIVGTICWIRLSHRRFERDTFIQFKSMLITFLTLTMLFLFELVVCDKLDSGRSQPSWSICFVPLFILSILAVAICIWSIRYDRSYEIELICSLNILQFVFIALRLDNTITWSWILVLVPVWIIMSIVMIVLLYIIILTIVMRKTNQSLAHHHNHHKPRHKWSNCLFYIVFVFSLLTFEILLTNKLDQEMSPPPASLLPVPSHMGSATLLQQIHSIMNMQPMMSNRDRDPTNYQPSVFSLNASPNKTAAILSVVPSSSSSHQNTLNLSYFQVTIPLYLAYFCLMVLSLNNHTGNTLWFGMRRDFCEYFLVVCPVFKTYGNVQIKWSFHDDNSSSNVGEQLIGAANGDESNRISTVNSSQGVSRHQPSRLNRSNETSLMTFNLAQGRSSNPTNNPSTHNYISLSLLEATGGGGGGVVQFAQPHQNHPQSMTSNDDESAIIIDVDSVSIANPLTAGQQSQPNQQQSLSSLPIKSKKHANSKSKRKQQQRDRDPSGQQSSSGRFNRQFSIPSYISNAYSDRASLKSFYFINNQTVNSSIFNGSGLVKKGNKVGKIIQLDVPD